MTAAVNTSTMLLLLALLCLGLHVRLSTCQYYGGWYGNNNWSNYNTQNYNNQNCNTMLQGCTARELSLRLRARMNGLQAVNPTQDLIANFDTNGDQCITIMEFNGVMAQRLFSAVYSSYRFLEWRGSGVGINDVVCQGGISVAALRTQPVTTAVAATINNNNVLSLINFCNLNPTIYQTNCDCIQLPSVCSMLPFQTTLACTAFRNTYASNTQCPFSYIGINVAKANCASGNFGTASAQMIPILRLLCNRLNQLNPTATVG